MQTGALMVRAGLVVIATAVPLVGYRVLEALLQVPGLEVHGPVHSVGRAVLCGWQAQSTLYICDDRLTRALLQAWPTKNGGAIIRITAEDIPQPAQHGPVVATLSLGTAGWDAQLRQFLGVDTQRPPQATSVPNRRRTHRASPLRQLLLPTSPDPSTARLDPVMALPGAAAFDEALRRLPGLQVPTLVLFVDVGEAVPPHLPAYRWFDQTGLRVQATVRDTDLVFRLDTALFAVLASSGMESSLQSLATRLRWVVCGTDLIDPARLVVAGSIWQPGTPVDLLLAEAWQGLLTR